MKSTGLQANRRDKSSALRRLRFEVLEVRLMLAAEPMYEQDWLLEKGTVVDLAREVVTDVPAEVPAVVPWEVLRDEPPVNGPPVVEVRLQATDDCGRPISHVAVGDRFWLEVRTRDLRDDPQGVFAVYMDIEFDEDLAELVGVHANNLTFGSHYTNGRSGTLTPGLLNEGGAFSDTTPLLSGEHLVFAVSVTASAAGTIDFTGNPADNPGNDILVYGWNYAVPTERVHYLGTHLTVLADGAAVQSLAAAERAEADPAGDATEDSSQSCPVPGSGADFFKHPPPMPSVPYWPSNDWVAPTEVLAASSDLETIWSHFADDESGQPLSVKASSWNPRDVFVISDWFEPVEPAHWEYELFDEGAAWRRTIHVSFSSWDVSRSARAVLFDDSTAIRNSIVVNSINLTSSDPNPDRSAAARAIDFADVWTSDVSLAAPLGSSAPETQLLGRRENRAAFANLAFGPQPAPVPLIGLRPAAAESFDVARLPANSSREVADDLGDDPALVPLSNRDLDQRPAPRLDSN